jgi:simple sugar transport system permease protein
VLFVLAVALLVAMAAGSALILPFGESPARVYALLLSETWGTASGIGQTLFRATTLVFTGLAVSLSFRAGLFNIGAEGQLAAGALATALAAAALPPSTPAALAIPVALIAGVAGGAALGAIPGALKARFGAHEVINTIMLNYIVAALALWSGRELWFLAETTHTAPVVDGARLPSLGIAGSAANASVFVALAAVAAAWFFLARTRRGFEWRAVGANPAAAAAAGVRIGATTIAAMTVSGAVAGLVGANYVLGDKHYFEEGMARGAGFMGIAVALLGRNHPIGIVAAALLLGTLAQGGLEINEHVPKEIVDVLQAVIILALATTTAWISRSGGGRRA